MDLPRKKAYAERLAGIEVIATDADPPSAG
jgi:hypothetical protein